MTEAVLTYEQGASFFGGIPSIPSLINGFREASRPRIRVTFYGLRETTKGYEHLELGTGHFHHPSEVDDHLQDLKLSQRCDVYTGEIQNWDGRDYS